jgi:hypothetical protein
MPLSAIYSMGGHSAVPSDPPPKTTVGIFLGTKQESKRVEMVTKPVAHPTAHSALDSAFVNNASFLSRGSIWKARRVWQQFSDAGDTALRAKEGILDRLPPPRWFAKATSTSMQDKKEAFASIFPHMSKNLCETDHGRQLRGNLMLSAAWLEISGGHALRANADNANVAIAIRQIFDSVLGCVTDAHLTELATRRVESRIGTTQLNSDDILRQAIVSEEKLRVAEERLHNGVRNALRVLAPQRQSRFLGQLLSEAHLVTASTVDDYRKTHQWYERTWENLRTIYLFLDACLQDENLMHEALSVPDACLPGIKNGQNALKKKEMTSRVYAIKEILTYTLALLILAGTSALYLLPRSWATKTTD